MTLPVSGSDRPALRVLLVLKTDEGGQWTLPHVDELRARGHEVFAVLPAGRGRLREALGRRGVEVLDSGFDFTFRPTLGTALGLARLRRQIRGVAPDVVFYHLYASALAARIATLRLGVPRVHMVAGPLYLESATIRRVERYLARLDTVTIGGSEFTAKAYRALGRTVAATPAIPYGVDAEYFQPTGSGSGVRAELGIAPGEFVAVMVAFVYAPKERVHAGRGVKGHDVLLDAWARFHAEHPEAHLVLVGGGFDDAGERHRLDLVERFGLSDPASGVHWVSTVADVRPYYTAADVSVSPSLSDNHGAALQAGAMGLPSIVSDAGALPETVDDACGWVVPRDDSAALVGALSEAYAEFADGLAARGAAARRFVLARFESRTAAARVVSLIEAAAGQASTPRVLHIFTEARFGRDVDGQWAANDAANGPGAWDSYLHGGNRVRLVARADGRSGTGSVPLPPAIGLVPLPHYVGSAALIRKFAHVVVETGRAVREAPVVVLRVPGVIGFVAAVACRLTGRKYAVDVVGDPADVIRAGILGRPGRLATPLVAAHMRWVVRGADASRFVTGAALQRRYPARPGTPTAGISDVRLGPGRVLDVSRRWAPGPHRIVMVGSQETLHKGHDVLLEAMRLLVDDGTDVTAVLVGGGRMQPHFEALSHRLGIADRVTFTGTVTSRAHILELLDSAHLFALPSRGEGMPRALIEAMARALPAVATAVGGIPELLDPSCVVPPDDAPALADVLGRLLRNPTLWERQSRRNLEAASAFDMAALDEEFAAWLARIPAARSRTSARSVP